MTEFHEPPSPSTAKRTLAQLSRAFVQRFADALPFPTIEGRAPRAAYWLDAAGALNHLRVDPYMLPNPVDRARPFILRVSVNFFRVEHRDAKLRRLDPKWKAEGCYVSSTWRFELSTLPEELLDFAPWVTSLVVAHVRNDPGRVGTEPRPCRFWKFRGEEILRCDYAWTRAAWDVVTIYEKHQAAARARRAARVRA